MLDVQRIAFYYMQHKEYIKIDIMFEKKAEFLNIAVGSTENYRRYLKD
jgi:hypothetical protein